MHRTSTIYFYFRFVAFVLLVVPISALSQHDIKQPHESICFEENRGQFYDAQGNTAPYVLFKAEVPGITIWITKTGITYQFINLEKVPSKHAYSSMTGNKSKTKTDKIIEWSRVDMILNNSNILAKNIQANIIDSKGARNYFIKGDIKVLDIKTFDQIIINNVYPGIDWKLYTSEDNSLKHEFIVHPSGNPDHIELIYEGKGEIEVKSNELNISTPFGDLTEGKLICFNKGKTINSSYQFSKNKNNSFKASGYNWKTKDVIVPTSDSVFSYAVKFNISEYDKSADLIIDPELVWGTLYGGNVVDGFTSMDIDKSDNLLITGYTTSSNFPVQDYGGYFQGTQAGNSSSFILKFNPDGALEWATYFGGDQDQRAYSIVMDTLGNAFITGFTNSPNFPIIAGSGYYQSSIAGESDVFISKFNSSGVLIWSTYFGGTLNESAQSVTIDDDQNILVTGYTEIVDFPLMDAGGYFQGSSIAYENAFILKFDNDGSLLWSTLFGGTYAEGGASVSADSLGNIFVTGIALSSDLPTMDPGSGAYFQSNNFGGKDVFILKFDNSLNLVWSTYYGGSEDEQSGAIIVDRDNNIFLGGTTGSGNFPTLNSGTFYQGNKDVNDDAYLLKFDNTGVRLWATFYGGGSSENFQSSDLLAVDDCNNIYFTFETRSFDIFKKKQNFCSYIDLTNGGLLDVFISKFKNNGELLWATSVGDSEFDFRSPIAIDSKNDVFLGGEFTDYFSSNNLPMMYMPGAFNDETPNGYDDSFILKFTDNPHFELSTTSSDCPCNGAVNLSLECGESPYNVIWSNGVEILNSTDTTFSLSNLCKDEYQVTISSHCAKSFTLPFTIEGEQCGNIAVPNVFTPNGDNTNDLFELITSEAKQVELVIINRWGNVVYSEKSASPKWDGAMENGLRATEGVYFYKVRVVYTDDTEFNKHGFFHLVRD